MTLLSHGQAGGKLDLHFDNHVSPFVFVLTLALRHPKMRESFPKPGGCRTASADWDLLAIDGRYCSLPAREGFFKTELNGGYEIVVLTLEKRMLFLRWY